MHACMLPRALEFDLERYETVMGYWYMACDVHEQGLDNWLDALQVRGHKGTDIEHSGQFVALVVHYSLSLTL